MIARHLFVTLAGIVVLVLGGMRVAQTSGLGLDVRPTHGAFPLISDADDANDADSDDSGDDEGSGDEGGESGGDEGGDEGGDDEDGGDEGSDDEDPDPPATGKTFSGTDCGGAGVVGLYVPTVGTSGGSAETGAEAGMYPTGSGAVLNSYASGAHDGASTVSNMNDAAALIAKGFGYTDFHPDWDDCDAVKAMVEDLRAAADTVCTSSCTLPATSPSSVTFIDDDFTVGSSDSGQGMLVVTGRLSFHALASWDGVLVVVGKGEFVRTGGSGDGAINGATIVGNIAGSDRTYGTSDDCTGAVNGFDAAMYHEAAQATGDTVYCTDNIVPAYPLRSFRVLDFRQRN